MSIMLSVSRSVAHTRTYVYYLWSKYTDLGSLTFTVTLPDPGFVPKTIEVEASAGSAGANVGVETILEVSYDGGSTFTVLDGVKTPLGGSGFWAGTAHGTLRGIINASIGDTVVIRIRKRNTTGSGGTGYVGYVRLIYRG